MLREVFPHVKKKWTLKFCRTVFDLFLVKVFLFLSFWWDLFMEVDLFQVKTYQRKKNNNVPWNAFSCLFVRSLERTPVISICLLQHHFVISCGRFPPPMAPLFYSLETIDTPSPVYLISKIFLILQIFEICSNGLCNALCNFEKFPWGQLVKILLLYPLTLWPFLCHWSP